MGHNYEEKRRYKLYKAKKRWVSAAIITASGAFLFLGTPSALADEAVTAEVTTTAQNEQQLQGTTQTQPEAHRHQPLRDQLMLRRHRLLQLQLMLRRHRPLKHQLQRLKPTMIRGM